MANTVLVTDSNALITGTAINDTQTDEYLLTGTGDQFVEIGGNFDITGGAFPPGPATDSDTTVVLTKTSGTTITGVTDNFTLDGDTNSLSNSKAIKNSTIAFTVLGDGGGNSVDLTDASKSTVSVTIGVDHSAHNPAGDNSVTIANAGGANTVNLGGPGNTVGLNGNATNSVTSTGGSAMVTIGFSDDDLFGNSSTVKFSGTGNTLNGGDENFTVSGSTGGSTVSVGDGNNTITMGGTGNTVTVWGGDNTINAGGGDATVNILGLDGDDSAKATPDADDKPVPLSPTDNVTISGTNDSVSATYENVNIFGLGVISAATIGLGNGDNSIILGGSGGNTVSVGNGANTINATGDDSAYTLGDGPNGVVLSGNGNTVTVTDPKGLGQDTVQLGAGENNTVNLDHAGGSVTGTAKTGTTTVTQDGSNAVTVKLSKGTGDITLGDGKDKVTANGAGSTFTLGNGNDTVTANGDNDTGAFGAGNDKLVATGSGDTWTFNSAATKTVTATLGSNDTLNQTNGALDATLQGAGDTLNLTNVKTAGTTINSDGNNETFDLSNGSGGVFNLNPSSVDDKLTFNGNNNDYGGKVTINGLSSTDGVDLEDLYTTGGVEITSFSQMEAAMSFTPTGDVLKLQGGGSITFAANTPLTAAEFHFS